MILFFDIIELSISLCSPWAAFLEAWRLGFCRLGCYKPAGFTSILAFRLRMCSLVTARSVSLKRPADGARVHSWNVCRQLSFRNERKRMRDIFEEIFINQPLDPMESARQGARPQLRKRFYERAAVGDALADGGFPILLDGKPVRTPARRHLAAPTHALAERIAQEWNAQEDVIDPARMPLTRLANAIIDAVADNPAPVADEIAKYLGSDLVCYRADSPEGLVAAQTQCWDPVLAWAHDALGACFVQIQGVMFSAQPDEAIAAARAAIPSSAGKIAVKDIWSLGAMSSITTLTGSALLALALAAGAITPEAAWAAAHVDEDFQMRQWGSDDLALARRAYRLTEFEAAATVLALLRS
jgi:chaperone required for assembly of F1-ATPase